MSQWVSHYAIWRDPSVAQGRGVPVGYDGVNPADKRPHPFHVTEDIQGQYFRHYVQGANLNRAPPDLGLIHQMLKCKNKSSQLFTETGWKEDNLNLNLVRLPHHRHAIAEQCVVCNVMKKHNFDIDHFLSLAMRVYTG